MVRRRLTLLDAMILIAAMAVAIAWTQSLSASFREQDTFDSTIWPAIPWKHWLMRWPTMAAPWMTAGSLGVLILRLRKPRPPLRELARQPGAAGCFVALASVTLRAGLMALGNALSQVPNMTMFGPDPGFAVADVIFWLSSDLTEVGSSVMGAWLILAAGRFWEAEPSAIDRAGRLLGVGWLSMLAAHRLGSLIIY